MTSRLASILRYRELIVPFCQRDLLRRYRGSILGVLWAVLQPLSMLAVYTFVFSVVFKARWGSHLGGVEDSTYVFALNLFAGLLVVNLFSEAVGRSADLVVNNTNYVKKVVFPIEVLSLTVVSSATANALIGVGILAIASWLVLGLSASILWIPVVWIPLVLITLGASWIVSAVGVYVRDVGQIVGLLLSILLFVTPVFYPLTALPANWQALLAVNPLARIVEQTRQVVIGHERPDALYLLVAPVLSFLFAELALRFFMKSKQSFADVL